ncbi:MAG: UDP-N-acetylmuramate dehydrogenase [Candidatus Spechtbacterales bacterium]|nr:UDP-N-acetylmuramate dehydrogenase [Candidatus Spechtbacterales bacterium]
MQIEENVQLAPYTTYKIGGPARYFVACKTAQDISEAISWAKENNQSYFVLGGGSNILVSDEGYNGLVISIQNTGYEVNGTTLEAGAGASMHVLVAETTDNSLEGLDWAGGLPGQLGGAIRGNAGAFGGEMKDVITEVHAVSEDGKVKTFTADECEFEYRTSFFKKNPEWIIISAKMDLKKGDREKLVGRVAELVEWRRTKHPMQYGNSGSIFKRYSVGQIPVSIFEKYPHITRAMRDGQIASAFFIDEAGLKLKKIGGAQVSDKHPNFIINESGTARAEDVIMLISTVKSSVLHQFGILLEEEIKFLQG